MEPWLQHTLYFIAGWQIGTWIAEIIRSVIR